MWGAQGGTYNGAAYGGKGGYTIGFKNLNLSNKLYICIGSQGGSNSGSNGGAGGYNGGGKGGNGFSSYTGAAGGGGATHIAITNNRGVLSSYINNKSEVLLVAGGGGGNGFYTKVGYGGGLNGGNAISVSNVYTITGATQNSGYAFGQGQDGKTKTKHGNGGAEGNGGGGGGWYGGNACQLEGNNSACSGSGGSGYVGTVTNGTTTAGVQSGNGKALITWMPVL